MPGLSVIAESWPILTAFLVLQGIITIPLVRELRSVYNARLDQYREQVAKLEERVKETAEERDRFVDYALEQAIAARSVTSATTAIAEVAERSLPPRRRRP